MTLPVTICLLALLTGCTVPQAPEPSPQVPPQIPNITVTVRGGDQILRSDLLERHRQSPPEPDYEESYYQRRPVYRPEPLPYREPSPLPYYTRPDPVDQIPLEPHRPTYPRYYEK